MNTANSLRLLILAAIWGGSFLFTRIGVPAFGPGHLIAWRIGLGAAFLLVVALWTRRNAKLISHWRYFAIVGSINTVVPFFLFAYAAKYLSASLLSVLNSLAPIFGAAIAAIWLGHAINRNTWIGLTLGVTGVAIAVGGDLHISGENAWLALAAGIIAPLCYGIASSYAKASSTRISSFDNAHGSLLAATLIIVPLSLLEPSGTTPSLIQWLSVIALGVLCTGVAYLIYFRLVADVGPTSALTVTFLVPVFGILWGTLLLDEPFSWNLVVGGACVVLGTALANRPMKSAKPPVAGHAPDTSSS